jgi:predicted phosphodiesterase
MRVAVISDIHGNCFALDAALADLRQHDVDQMVCLGDAIQGGAQPVATVQRLREIACPMVMGNADAWLLAEENDTVEPTTAEQREVRAWTLAQLADVDLAFIRGFKPTVEVPLAAGQRLLCFHGSPASFDDVLQPDTPQAEWQRLLAPYAPAIMTGGHTHTQQMRRVGDGVYFNPGSIGVAFNILSPEDQDRRDPWAEYAILTVTVDGALSLDFRRVPFDVERLIEIIQASGRPHAGSLSAQYLQPNS